MNLDRSKYFLYLLVITAITAISSGNFSIAFVFARQAPPRIQALRIDNKLYDAQWSPDGQMLAVSGDMGVNIYNNSLQEIAQLRASLDFVGSLSWRPDSLQLAAAGGLGVGKIEIWDFYPSDQTFTLNRTLSSEHEREFAVAWNHAGTELASIRAEQPHGLDALLAAIEIWDTSSGQLIRTSQALFIDPTRSVFWSPDDAHVVAAGTCRTEIGICPSDFHSGVFMIDVSTGLIDRYMQTPQAPSTLAGSNHGKFAVGYSGVIETYDFNSLQKLSEADYQILVYRLAWNPGGSKIAFSYNGASGGILDVQTNVTYSFDYLYQSSGQITGLDWTPDGTHVATVSLAGFIEVWDASML